MRDLPIPFMPPMVRAILREIEAPGTGKTQTRRLVSKQPTLRLDGFWNHMGYEAGILGADAGTLGKWMADFQRYQPGDRLYVREHWRVAKKHNATAPRDLESRSMSICFEAGGRIANDENGQWRPQYTESLSPIPNWAGKFRHGMHMPKWASRITLLVTDVRVERLQDCSDNDALAEGVEGTIEAVAGRDISIDGQYWPGGPQRMYRELWDSINDNPKKPGRAWRNNPWVVAYSFRPMLGNIDMLPRSTRGDA